MPLTSFQREVLSSIAQNRDPESDIAGGTVLQYAGVRLSDDTDIFHDREERLAEAVRVDNASLTGAGFAVDWVVDAEFRFFPTRPDPVFGALLRPDGGLAQPGPDLPGTLADLVVHHGSRKRA